MAAEIPIQNLYYLLCYAWNQLAEGEEIDIAADQCKSLTELFARVLANGTQQLLRRSLDRSYLSRHEETSRLRGRLMMTESLSRQSWERGAMVCEFADLSHNILPNRILKTTISQLLHAEGIGPETHDLLHQQAAALLEIEPIRLTSRHFHRVPLHRNNRHYRFLLNVCELLYDSRLPEQRDGQIRFRDFVRDPRRMPYLFEKFVKNFYRHEQTRFRVGSIQFSWIATGKPADLAVLPRMKTDVSLKSKDRSIILDCKFYKEAMAGRFESEKVHTANLYQLYAYLRNVRAQTGWADCEGFLLYPAVDRHFDHEFVIDAHSVRVTSVDLNQPWKSIHESLLSLLKRSQP